MKRKPKSRYGTPADIARLDFHNWFGQLHDRMKAKTTEKDKGVLMIEKIQHYFGISMEYCRQRLHELNMEAMKPTEVPKEIKQRKIKFTRDSRGEIISPFRTEK